MQDTGNALNALNWKRHTLLDVSDTGRESILTELMGTGSDRTRLNEKIKGLILPDQSGIRAPGIVRREDAAPRPGRVPIGFCQLVSSGKERLRIAAFVRPSDVVRATSPYELMSFPIHGRTASTKALLAAKTQAGIDGLVLGVWGSAAMELYTGQPCTHDGSDLDLLLAASSVERLSRFLTDVQAMEERFALRIDVEVDLPSGYGVHLKELFGQGRTLLGKSMNQVALLSRDQVLGELPQEKA